MKERFREEESRAVALGYVRHGPRWAHIARELRGRTDSAVKNHWNNYLRQRFVRLLSDILQTPQVSDIRAAAAFGVGPTMLKAAIMSNAPPFSRIEGNNTEKTQTEDYNPSECVSGQQSQSSDGSEGPDNNNEMTQSLYPEEENFPGGTENVNLISRLQNNRKLPTIEEFMTEAALENFNQGLVSVARNQMMRKAVQFQGQQVEDDYKSGGNLRSWRKNNSFNLSPLDMFASCTGINNPLQPTMNLRTEPITSEEVTECEGRRSNNELSPTSFSSCSTNMFGSRSTENGLEIGIGKNTIQSSRNIFNSLIGNCSYSLPSSPMLRQSRQHSEIDLYHDSFRNVENNNNSGVNKNIGSASFPTANFLNNVQTHPLRGLEGHGEDQIVGNHWNPVALPLLSSGGDNLNSGGINQCGVGGFSASPFYSAAEIVPSFDQMPNVCTKEDESVNLSPIMETLLTLLNEDVDMARQFLENLSDSQRSQIEEHLYQSSGSLEGVSFVSKWENARS